MPLDPKFASALDAVAWAEAGKVDLLNEAAIKTAEFLCNMLMNEGDRLSNFDLGMTLAITVVRMGTAIDAAAPDKHAKFRGKFVEMVKHYIDVMDEVPDDFPPKK